MANATLGIYVDISHPTTNAEREQRSRIFLEAASIAQNDTLEYVREDDDAASAAMPPMNIELWTHDGGMENAVDGPLDLADGDDLIIEAIDPDHYEFNKAIAATPDLGWTRIYHTLSGVTEGAATAQEIADSLNSDREFTRFGFAAASIATADRVSIFPKGVRGKIRIAGGAVQTAAQFPGGVADNATRTFTRVAPTDFAVTYVPAEKTVRITRTGATAAERVTAVILLY